MVNKSSKSNLCYIDSQDTTFCWERCAWAADGCCAPDGICSLTSALLMQRRFFVHEGGNTAMKKVIELRNVTKQFDGETVLDSINLDITTMNF